MSVEMRKSMTLQEFLAWEEGQELHRGFAPVAMSGGTVEQGLIQASPSTAPRTLLRAGPCHALGGGERRAPSVTKVRAPGSVTRPPGSRNSCADRGAMS
jgi:hypothetical protein